MSKRHKQNEDLEKLPTKELLSLKDKFKMYDGQTGEPFVITVEDFIKSIENYANPLFSVENITLPPVNV